jgi:diacylglycerol kinase family enzyme
MAKKDFGKRIGKFAVLLNANARKVSQEVLDEVGEIVAPEDLFLSSSQEEAEEIVETIVERGYEAVFAGGGDGTVIQFIEQLSRWPEAERPSVGILKLGTGNAMARMVSSGNVIADLQTYASNSPRDYYDLSLVEAEGRRFTFCGFGLDATILNDYISLKNKAKNGIMKAFSQNLGGYFLSFFSKTVPRGITNTIKRESINVKITTLDDATQIGWDGAELRSFKPGEIIYEGSFLATVIGTEPYFGYGFKVLPHTAIDPNKMQIRVAKLSMLKAFVNLGPIWKGKYSGSGVHDYLATRIKVEFDKDAPFEIAGDAEGFRREMEFSVIPKAVRLLHLF